MRELFDKLLPIFLENGGKLFEFYDATYGEINAVIKANRSRVKQEYQMAAKLAYQSARLNSYAFNDPASMPAINEVFPGLFDEPAKTTVQQPDGQQDWRIMLQNIQIYADSHNAKLQAEAKGEQLDINHE